jgi:hypothetical protein
MTPIDEPASFGPESPSSQARKARSQSGKPEASAARLVSFTLEPETGRLIRIDAVDAAGNRSELPEELRSSLATGGDAATLDSVVAQAFEAGIDCVLGADGAAEDPEESDEDAELRRALLRSLIERSAAKRLLQPDVLGRAVIATWMAEATNSGTSQPPSH